MSIQFSEFPRSYRYSQSGIAFTLVSLAIFGTFLRAVPVNGKLVIGAVFAVIVAISLLISNYVIVRYPYISLVEPEDGDHFSKHFASAGSPIYKLIKLLGFLVPIVTVISIFGTGVDTLPKVGVLIYLLILIPFMYFFNFRYDPIKHPTISTMIRSTLGFGIVLFPLFLPSVILGSMRCASMLEDMDSSGEGN